MKRRFFAYSAAIVLLTLFLVPKISFAQYWAVMDSGITEEYFWGIWGSSANDVFAVGGGMSSDPSCIILHYDGTSWSEVECITENRLENIWGSSATDVFAVGWEGTILHYDGTSWSAMESGTNNTLTDVWGTSGNDVFAVGSEGTILHYDGLTWTKMESGMTDLFMSIWGSSGTDVFTVSNNATILHYDGSIWSEMESGTTKFLLGVWGSSGEDVFVVGRDGTIIHFDGSSWSEMNSGVINRLTSVWGTSGTDVYVVGENTILHYDGSTWSIMSDPILRYIYYYDVWGSSLSDIFVVGKLGVILRSSTVPTGGSIVGQVTRDPTGDPIEDVRISLYDSNGSQLGQYAWSDGEGYYSIYYLPTGDYYVKTENLQGFFDEWYGDADPDEGDPPPVHVDDPNATTNIDFALVLGGTISGQVTRDPTGEPLGGIDVRIVDSTGLHVNSARTDANGHYRVDQMHTGDIFVYTYNSQGYIDEWYQGAEFREDDLPPVRVEAPNETSNINFALELGGSISGQVTVDGTGEALEDISIYVYDSNGDSTFQYSWSDSEGHYTVSPLPTGDYYLTTGNDQGFVDEWYGDADPDEGDPPPVHVDAPSLTPNIDFTLVSGGGAIGGVITDCDDPSILIDSVLVYAYEWDTENLISSGFTDVTGSYEIPGLPTGSYQICTHQFNGSYIDKCNESPIEFVAEDGHTLDLCMEVGGSISGTINCQNCMEGLILVWALSEPEPDLSNIGGTIINSVLIFTHGPYTMEGLPYDREMWIYAEWRQIQYPTISTNYYGVYEASPITLTEGGPYPTDINIHIQNMGCIADYDCDGICDPGESAPNCSGTDECPYDAENDMDGDGSCGDSDNCPNYHNPGQEDTFPPEGNGIGDACECEGDFDCDMDQDGSDAAQFKEEFGRSSFYDPCTEENPCSADFDVDGVVDGMDAAKFKEDFGRCSYNDPCPVCIVH